MKKKKKKKLIINKKILIILSIILIIVICLSIGLCIFINNTRLKVVLNKNNKVNINEKIYNTTKIKKVKNGTIVSKKELVKTNKLGKKTITIKIKNKFNKTINYKYNIVVIDKEKPEIIVEDKITIEEGTEIDLLKQIEVKDNSKEKIEPKIEGEYDINTPGEYKLKIMAQDKSKNKIEKEIILEVTKKEEVKKSNNKKTKTSKGYTIEERDGITYIDGIMVVNKTYSIPSSYNPGDLTSTFNNAFNEMKNAAANDGINIFVISGFRSYNYQNTLYNKYATRDGYAAADTYSARPGHSEHQTGLAADLNAIDDNLDQTPEGKWLYNNAWKYGFILRYTKNGVGETGYKYEPWHFRYVGKNLAAKLYNNGNWLTLESYFGITSEYS